ncbi:MAG: tetratricopeptide repeat protein [Planctomycetota bacterium]
MTVNVRRLFVVLGVVGTLGLSSYSVYRWRSSDQHNAARLEASIQSYLDDHEFPAARLEAEKLLRLRPNDARAHYLRGIAFLAGKPTTGIPASDTDRIAGVRSLIKAAKLGAEHRDALTLLVSYFLSVGEYAEAEQYAKVLLRLDSSNADAHFAIASSLLAQSQPKRAQTHVTRLLEQETPARPRTLWLLARIADSEGKNSKLPADIEQKLKASMSSDKKWSAGLDQLALVELAPWLARYSKMPGEEQEALAQSLFRLESLVDSPALNEVPPRAVLNAMDRLTATSKAPKELVARIDALVERVFKRSVETELLDPMVYLHFANRLLLAERGDSAAEVARQGIERAKKYGPEARLVFAVCDLWLAEYHLSRQEPSLASPYISALDGMEPYRPRARLLAGYAALQEGTLDQAASLLAEANASMPRDGATCALYGLCQLRRGLVSEGRQLLEQGIRLGASEPRYRAWLALALAEAGYHEQGVTVARELLADPSQQGLGRVLLGQLRLRAGQYSSAEKDLADAVEKADPSFRPALRLSMAELAVARGDWEIAEPILVELKSTPLAPQAIALEYRRLVDEGKREQADQLLSQARTRHPENTLLLAVAVKQLLKEKRFDDAVAVLAREQASGHQSLTPTLLLAEVHELAGNEPAALEVLRKACAAYPQEVALSLRLAEKLLAREELEECARLLGDLTGNPRVQQSTLDALHARLAASQGNLAKAEDILAKAVKKDPDNPTLKFLLGQIAAQNGRHQDANHLFQQSLASGTLWRHGARALFESLLCTGETEKAIELLSQIQQRGQPVANLRRRLLELLARREQWSQLDQEIAVLLGDRATEEDFALAAAIHRSVEQPDKGMAVVERGLERFPDSQRLKEHKVALLLETNQWQEARNSLTPLLAQDPHNPTAQAMNIELLLLAHDSATAPETKANFLMEAAKGSEEAWDRCRGNLVIAALRTQVLLRGDREADALAFLEEARQAHPELPAPTYLVARMLESLGKNDRALTLLKETVASHPNNTLAASHLLRLESTVHEAANLLPTVEKMLEKNPSNTTLLATLAEQQISRGMTADAKQSMERLESLKANPALVAYLKALFAFQQGDLVNAEAQIQRSLADPRQHIPSTLLLTRIRSSQGNNEEALKLVTQVARRSPQLLTARLAEVSLLARVGRLDEAEKTCRDFLAHQPNTNSMRLALANVLLQRGDEKSRREATDLAVSGLKNRLESPGELESWSMVAFRGGADAEACRVIEQYVEKGEFEWLLGGGRAYFEANRPEDAVRLARRLLELKPEDTQAILLCADSLARLGEQTRDRKQFEEAAGLYRKILEKEPSHAVAANNLAWTIGVRLHEPRRALEELCFAVPAAKSARNKLSADLLDTVGTLYYLLERWPEARDFLEAAIEKQPANPSTHFHLGMVHLKQQRSTLAKQCFAKVLKLDPDGPWARQIRETKLAN